MLRLQRIWKEIFESGENLKKCFYICYMNILFVNNSEVNPLHSGIQRITWVLAKAFEGRGMACYGANFEKDTPTVNGLFRAVQKLDFTEEASQELAAFIRRHGITRVIVQECWPLKKLAVVSRATRSVEGCKLLYCYHSMPGKEFVPPSAGTEFYRLLHGQGKIRTLKKGIVALLPRGIFRRLVAQRARRDYAFMWEAADEIVLLSASYIPLVDVGKLYSAGGTVGRERRAGGEEVLGDWEQPVFSSVSAGGGNFAEAEGGGDCSPPERTGEKDFHSTENLAAGGAKGQIPGVAAENCGAWRNDWDCSKRISRGGRRHRSITGGQRFAC